MFPNIDTLLFITQNVHPVVRKKRVATMKQRTLEK